MRQPIDKHTHTLSSDSQYFRTIWVSRYHRTSMSKTSVLLRQEMIEVAVVTAGTLKHTKLQLDY